MTVLMTELQVYDTTEGCIARYGRVELPNDITITPQTQQFPNSSVLHNMVFVLHMYGEHDHPSPASDQDRCRGPFYRSVPSVRKPATNASKPTCSATQTGDWYGRILIFDVN